MISLWSDTKIIISVIVIAALFFFYQKIKHENYAAGEKHQIEIYVLGILKMKNLSLKILSLFLLPILINACTNHITPAQECRKPLIPPSLNATQEMNSEKELKKLWLLETDVMN